MTDPSNGPHAINIVLQRIVDALERHTGLRAQIERPHPVVSIVDNYDRLYYEADAVARSSRYSHYVDDHTILRTHTTSAIPGLLKAVTEPVLLIVPGLVYRRDVVDRMHVGEPHQVDLWHVQRGRMGRRDMLDMISCIVEAILPGAEYRCNETHHPYTINGLEVEVLLDDRWVEVLECGQINPWLLDDSGLPSNEWSGLAMGIGLDRLVMLLKRMTDIRLLRSSDPRIARQMTNLEPYIEVSAQPPMKRDMSLCVSDPDMEIIGDRIRVLLGDRVDWLEDVEVLGEHAYDAVPEAARARLGMQEGQTNLLIRLILRAPERALTREEGNAIYDDVYRALHENAEGYL